MRIIFLAIGFGCFYTGFDRAGIDLDLFSVFLTSFGLAILINMNDIERGWERRKIDRDRRKTNKWRWNDLDKEKKS